MPATASAKRRPAIALHSAGSDRRGQQAAGADTIALQANATYLLSLTSTQDSITADLIVSDSLTITGAGPNSTIIDGNGADTGQRVFVLFRCVGNVVNQQN
jgi:hypothetical protein